MAVTSGANHGHTVVGEIKAVRRQSSWIFLARWPDEIKRTDLATKPRVCAMGVIGA
jgi:hypothetical protein